MNRNQEKKTKKNNTKKNNTEETKEKSLKNVKNKKKSKIIGPREEYRIINTTKD